MRALFLSLSPVLVKQYDNANRNFVTSSAKYVLARFLDEKGR